MIELKNVRKAYGDHVILQDINTVVNEGDVVAIVGPSGCGKSTLLNCFNILDPPTEGEVLFKGADLMKEKNLEPYRQKIGMVFQSYNLFNHMTVLENVMTPQVELLHRPQQEALDRAVECLRQVGMADKKFSYPDELSGGQKQRVAIAREIAMDPDLILMDEPTSALDPTMVGEVEYVIKKLADSGRTMIIVTHSMPLARKVSNRVFYMDEKGIYEDAPTEVMFNNPRREKTRAFIRQLKLLPLVVDSKDFDFVTAVQKIDEFGQRFDFSQKRITNMQRLFEEICVEGLLPHLPDNSKVRAEFIYDEPNDKLKLKIYYPKEMDKDQDGEVFDDISLALIQSAKEEIEVEQIGE